MLLVSVRSQSEALEALSGGANIIDIKEPSRGPLGMADPARIAEILRAVAGCAPVTAALGELRDWDAGDRPRLPDHLRAVKVGLAGEARCANWRERLSRLAARLSAPLVAVAYADFAQVQAPPAEAVLDWAIHYAAPALLLDTAVKDGRTLLDHISPSALRCLIERARSQRVPVALAGSIQEASIPCLTPLGADVLAVRSAACAGGDRHGRVGGHHVRRLRDLIAGAQPAQATREG